MFLTSYEFLGFLLVVFGVYYAIPQKFQWPFLLVASYMFYFLADSGYLAYILATTATTYFAACQIEKNTDRQKAFLSEQKAAWTREEKKAYKEKQKKIRFRWLLSCLLINLGILAAVKYSNFAIANLNGIWRALGKEGGLSYVSLALPMGISFYTFQAIGYLVDIYRGACRAEKNPFKFALFLSFFPQLIQGPISRFNSLSKTLYRECPFNAKNVCYGLQRMLWGYFKKLVIADRIMTIVRAITGDVSSYFGAYAFLGMIFYTVQLYADFTGGIDITIGIAETMGITAQENFIRPYFSKSLREYWNRWHISMCSWFKDYIFYPVSMSRWMRKFQKFIAGHFGDAAGKRVLLYASSFLVWLATGIWHGASWNFVVWGLLNWAVLMISEELEPFYGKFHARVSVKEKTWYRLFQILRTFLLVCVLNLFDCYASLSDTFAMLISIFRADNWHILWDGSLLSLGIGALDYLILALGTAVLIFASLWQRTGSLREKIAKKPYPLRFAVWYGMFLSVLLAGAYGIGYDASQFIYNRF